MRSLQDTSRLETRLSLVRYQNAVLISQKDSKQCRVLSPLSIFSEQVYRLMLKVIRLRTPNVTFQDQTEPDALPKEPE
jgi:hypothetical protein